MEHNPFSRYSEEDVQFLKDNYKGEDNIGEIAMLGATLDKSEQSVRTQLIFQGFFVPAQPTRIEDIPMFPRPTGPSPGKEPTTASRKPRAAATPKQPKRSKSDKVAEIAKVLQLTDAEQTQLGKTTIAVLDKFLAYVNA